MSRLNLTADGRTRSRLTVEGATAATYAGPTLRALSAGRNTNPTLPAGTADGDVGLLIVNYSGADGTPDIDITVGGGAWATQTLWTPPADALNRLFGWWDVYGSTPTAPTLSGGTQPGNYQWEMLTFIGASPTAPVEAAAVNGTHGANLAMLPITTLGDDRYVLNIFGYRFSDDGILSFGSYNAPALVNRQEYAGVDTVLKIVDLQKIHPSPPISAGQWGCSAQPSMRATVAIKA